MGTSNVAVHLLIFLQLVSPVTLIDTCDVCKCFEHTVNCDSKGITRIPDDLSADTHVLYLRGNSIHNISTFPYDQLQELYLDDNVIDYITDGIFQTNIQLEILSLAGNRLSEFTFSADTFKTLQDLKVLNLSANGIRELPSEAIFHQYFRSLRTLDLSNNNLRVIDSNAFTDIKTLETILLQNNNISSLSTQFQGLESLKNANLSRNHLVTLPDGIFSPLSGGADKGTGIRIDVSINNISEISPVAFQGIKNIALLDVSHNNLTSIPFKAIQTDKVQTIDSLVLDSNTVSTVAPPIGSFSGNGVKSISLRNAGNLTVVRAYSFSSFVALEAIELSDNPNLQHFDENAFVNASKHVRHVSFAGNKLSTLSSDMLPWQQLAFLNVSTNRWRCDKDLIWMKKLFPKFTNTSGPVICSSPPELKGKNILDIPDSSFAPTPGPTSGPGGGAQTAVIVCGVVIIVAIIGAFLVYKFRHTLFYRHQGRYRTIHNAYSFGGQETIAQYDGDETASLTKPSSNGPVNL